MTTAHYQAAATRLACVLLALFLSGCGDSVTRYRIDGAFEDFCVPRSIDSTPTRPGTDAQVRGGFTLSGCWNASGEACKGPKTMTSLAVVSKNDYSGWRFGDFGDGAHIKNVAISQSANAKNLANNLIAIPERAGSKTWFIWQLMDTPHTAVRENDQLMAVCEALDEYQGYSCDRRILGPDYTLIYSYFSSNTLPTSFVPLDAQVLSSVETLRCRQQAPNT
ncbi:hypothetical protein [Stenotrophomonas sp. PS02289]|uniref:hypothetical protein n=1 Tax=Stenotrophomonas sp. PS02289 TaxID=2991422 RepID=UPI00249CE5D1|nr:hypothetical protein [Stenotrophomonas sp. PS02289]